MGSTSGIDSTIQGTSLRAIAAAIGVDRSYMSLIMAGKRTPSLPVARRLAEHFGVPLGDLDEYLRGLPDGRATV